jgi:hypothetical protein
MLFKLWKNANFSQISLPVRLAQDCMRQSFFDLDFDIARLVYGAVRLDCLLRKGRCLNLGLAVKFRKQCTAFTLAGVLARRSHHAKRTLILIVSK